MSLVLRPPIKAAGLGCALSVLALVEHRATGDSWWAAAAGVAVVGVVVAIRSTGPLLAWAAAVALLGVTWTLTGGRVCVYQLALVAVASWWAGRASGDARALGAMLGVGATAVAVIVAAPRGGSSVGESLGTGLVLFANLLVLAAVPWLFGLRFSRAEASHRSSINEARARERRRIAREMHDSLGHELSLITLRAGALEVARGLDDRHRASAAALREAAGSATERLSEIVGLLPGDGQAPPSPGTETLRDLVDRARDSGLPVAFERDRPEVVAGMTPVGRRAVHRIVQESLTNAAKHAPGAAVEVRLDPRPGWLRVVVANERPSRPGARPGNGLGLVGLAERARAAGGTLSAGPTGEGGYVVAADLPLPSGGTPWSGC